MASRKLSEEGQAHVSNKGKTVVRISSLKARMIWVRGLIPCRSFYKDGDICNSCLLSLKCDMDIPVSRTGSVLSSLGLGRML